MTKLSAILATGRISNLPTVWSNLLVAFLFAGSLSESNYTLFAVACISASLLYVGGCFLGDAVDVEFDMAHKPSRPIPTGVLTRSSVYSAASVMLGAGVALPISFVYLSLGALSLSLISTLALLTASIVTYSLWHKNSPAIGLPLIAACRIFLVLFGYSLTAPILPDSFILIVALTVGLYTVCFASVARGESSPKPISWRKSLITLMLSLPVIVHFLKPRVLTSIPPELGAGLGIYVLWLFLAFSHLNTNKGKFVAMSLAGFCILDLTFAAAFSPAAAIATLILFAASLTLQKWAPAT